MAYDPFVLNNEYEDEVDPQLGVQIKPDIGVENPFEVSANPFEVAPQLQQPEIPSGGAMDTVMWLARPFMALGSAGLAPIVHDYKADDPWYEPFRVSGKAFVDDAFPTYGEQREHYEGIAADKLGIDQAEHPYLHMGASVAIGFLSDPAILAFPFMKQLKAGLAVGAMTKTASGPWKNALEEAVSFVNMSHSEIGHYKILAGKADKGDTKAAYDLLKEVTELEGQTIQKIDNLRPQAVSITERVQHFAKDAIVEPVSGVIKGLNEKTIGGIKSKVVERVGVTFDKHIKSSVREARRTVQDLPAYQAIKAIKKEGG